MIVKSRLLVVSLAFLLMIGCSSNGGGKSTGEAPKTPEPAPAQKNPDPVKLKILISMGWLGPGEFDKYFVEPVQKKYPHISFEVIDQSKAENSLDKMVAAGIIPDIVMQASALPHRFFGLGLETDIGPLIKNNNFNLSQIDPVAVDSVTATSGSKFLTGLPWTKHFSALYYNKDIFDKFGVPYPKDGMSWEELREVAVKLTRNEGGVQYRGMEPDQPGGIASALSLSAFDPAAKKATLNNDNWKRVFTVLKSFYDIPGNTPPKFANGAWDQFVKDKTLAMYPTNNRLPNLKDVPGLNWDIAQYPSLKEAPNTGMGVDVWILHLTQQSKYKNEAFQAISTILSEEVQADMARNARVPVLQSSKVQQEFGKNLPYLKDKHLEAVFKSKPAKVNLITQYDSLAGGILQGAITKVASGEKDINTALREAEEEYNSKIPTVK